MMAHISNFQILVLTICTVLVALTSYLWSPAKNDNLMQASAAKNLSKTMTSTLASAKIIPRRSSARGHADHGWLNSYHSFSFASYHDRRHESWGALRVLNEDRVAPGTGFPTHPHRDFEIFSYILNGQLTHRDSIVKKGSESNVSKDQFYRMERGDVQFTTGGTGIAHSEQNEHGHDWVHFLQLWAKPWKNGLKPSYHTATFPEADKRQTFVPIISPLKAGVKATADEEAAAEAVIKGTIPVHADLMFSAGIIPTGEKFEYSIGGYDAVSNKSDRKLYIHLPMTKGGKAKVKLDGREDSILNEGDGAYVSSINAGQVLSVESVGDDEAEVVLVDSN